MFTNTINLVYTLRKSKKRSAHLLSAPFCLILNYSGSFSMESTSLSSAFLADLSTLA